MICNLCGQSEATIHLTEIVNNQMVEIHLCQTCAQEKGTDFKTHFNFSDLISGFPELVPFAAKAEKKSLGKCPECGLTYEEFGKSGRLGCENCYESFSKLLLPLIKRVQRSAQHMGKKPPRMASASRPPAVQDELRGLHDRLRKSVQAEAFEEAAKLRDEISQLEEKMKKGKKPKSE